MQTSKYLSKFQTKMTHLFLVIQNKELNLRAKEIWSCNFYKGFVFMHNIAEEFF